MKSISFMIAFFILFGGFVQGQQSQPGIGSIRLLKNNQTSTSEEGIVEIYYNSKWGGLCDINIGFNVGDTVCRQLGYGSGSTTSNSGYGISNPPVLSDISCNSNDLTVLQCSHSSIRSSCSTNNNIAVSCSGTPINFPGSIRLSGETKFSGSGLVEFYCNGEYGYVCASDFEQNDANTVCKQLGYTQANEYGSSFGNGDTSKSIWLSNPNCDSDTKCLSTCKSCPITEISSCNHTNIVGVTCSFASSDEDDAGSSNACLFADNAFKYLGAVIAVVVIFVLIVIALAIAIPIICCCCLGVGLGAAAARGSRRNYTNF